MMDRCRKAPAGGSSASAQHRNCELKLEEPSPPGVTERRVLELEVRGEFDSLHTKDPKPD